MAKVQSKWVDATKVTVGRLATATLGGDALHVIRHESLKTTRIAGDELEIVHGALRDAQLDDRDIHVAVDAHGTLFVLDGDGQLFRRSRGKGLEPIVPAGPYAAGHYAHRVGFVWDAEHERLVIVGGRARNDTWFLRSGDTQLHALRAPGPRHGIGSTVATRHGVYHLVEDELWRLHGDTWSFVAPDPHRALGRKAILLHDPVRDRLFSIAQIVYGDAGPAELVPIGEEGFGAPIVLGGDLRPVFDFHDDVLGYDPVLDRLLRIGPRAAKQLPLAALLPPKSTPPTRSRKPPKSRVARAPVHWYREALALGAPESPVDVALDPPDDSVLLATFPECPHLPFEKGRGVALFAKKDAWEHDAGTLSFENAFEVRIVDEPLPVAIHDGKALVRRATQRFFDVDPTYATRVDTRAYGEAYLARRSKIGGFPWLVQGGREEAASASFAELKCESCYTTLRFAVQLSDADTGWFMSGVIYLYLCPFGCWGAAHAQAS